MNIVDLMLAQVALRQQFGNQPQNVPRSDGARSAANRRGTSALPDNWYHSPQVRGSSGIRVESLVARRAQLR
jgi:hypothetical protein